MGLQARSQRGEGGREEEENRDEGRGQEEERLSAESSRQGAGWLSLHVRGSLSSCREEHCLKNKGGGWVLC